MNKVFKGDVTNNVVELVYQTHENEQGYNLGAGTSTISYNSFTYRNDLQVDPGNVCVLRRLQF